MKRLFCLLVCFVFLVGCSFVYGQQVFEERKAFGSPTEFSFDLVEPGQYQLLLQIAYAQTAQRNQGALTLDLLLPNGTLMTREIGLENIDKKAKNFVYNSIPVFKVRLPGTYSLTVRELEGSSVRGQHFTLTVFKK